ncbi:MAG: Ig-like domain repeat protein [Actinomycetota bacterium]|nr:Ig-like domain repeat protein [Actinomycetota bacterium]MDA8168063.1 Ig-like domain repeat protein [Actinomycetota bacterium]
MAVSPNFASDQTLFAATWGGVFKSTNGGTSWSAVNSGLTGTTVNSVAVSPNFATDHTLFAGTWGGVFISTNGGTSWSAVNSGLTGTAVNSVAVSPNFATDHTLFAGISGGVFISTNGGTSWSAVNSGLTNTDINSVALSPNFASDQTLFAGTLGGVFKTTNGGTSWSAVNSGLTSTAVKSVALSPNFASDQTLFAGTFGGVFLSTNAGGSWSAVNSGLTGTTVNSVAVSPNFATDHTLFAGTSGGVFLSTNAGASWSAINSGLTNTDINSVALSPNFASDHTLFAGTWGDGVFKSTNGGTSWSAINSGLASTAIKSVALSPNFASDQTLFAATWGGVFISTNAGGSWSAINSGLTSTYISSLALSPNFATDHTLFAGTYGGVFLSTNAGGSWSAINSGLTNMYIYSVALSPNFATDHTLFAGTAYGVFISTNAGNSWSAINSGLTSTDISSLALSPNFATDHTLFAGTYGGGVFISTNAGTSWSAVNSGLASTDVNSVALSPNFASDQTLFAGTAGGVFLSTNAGTSWSAINSGLTNMYIYSVALSPNFASDQTLFAGTWGGVFKTTNGGTSWSAINSGLASTAVRSVALSPNFVSDQTLFAGTWGDGVFSYTFQNTTPPSVTNLQPSGLISTTSTTITADYADSGSGINSASAAVALDGTAVSGCTATATSISCPVTGLAEGAHNYTVSVADNAGNTGTASGSFMVDSVAPAVSGIAPTGTLSSASVTVYANFTDSGASISSATAQVYLDSGVLSGCTATATSISCPVTGLANGSHTIKVSVADNAGNTAAASGSFTVSSDTTPPALSNLAPTGTLSSASVTVYASYTDSGAGINSSSAAVYLDGSATRLSGCTATATSISCPVSGLAEGAHTIKVSVADNAGNTSRINGSFTVAQAHNYYWAWYDGKNMTNWILMADPTGSGHNLSFGLGIASVNESLDNSFGLGAGVIAPGDTLKFKQDGTTDGPVKLDSLTGGKALVSQRILFGNSFEEVPGTDEASLSGHYYWTWYDGKNMADWVLVANPSATDNVYYRVRVAGQVMPQAKDNPGVVAPGAKVTPQFGNIIGGPVEVTSCSQAFDQSGNCPGTSPNVIASQRVLSNGSTAFNEVPGTPASQLSGLYYWTWYDGKNMADWVLVANPSATDNVYYQVRVAGQVMPQAKDNPGIIAPGKNVTPQFDQIIGGPVEVTSCSQAFDQSGNCPGTSPNVIASQRSTTPKSFEEVPGYPAASLAGDYNWTWYDGKNSANWVLVANPSATDNVYYQVSIAGQVMPPAKDNPGVIDPGKNVTPMFDGTMNGPVEVRSCSQAFSSNGSCPGTTPSLIASQRVLWNGFFNEVLGTVLN